MTVIIVTGASGGIGFHTALELAQQGHQVVIAARGRERGEAAAARIGAEWRHLDLGDLTSVRRFAQDFRQRYGRLDVLINNAGVMAVPRRELTTDGFERQFGVNHLGHFALTGLLLPALEASDDGRVVTVTSGLHRRGRIDFDDLMGERRYRQFGAYCQSKLANVLFGLELGRRTGLTSVLAHPGVAHTDLARTGSRARDLVIALVRRSAQSAAAGAQPILRAVKGKTGEAYGPDGPGERRGKPTRIEVSPAGRDETVARRLWAISEELTGVRYGTLTTAQ
ncbi:oxidoreductase [Actinoplanes sp. NPDC026670]|uniref:oxidoreductase n=1 Tax=Actinoplanes sp. NPDC026670 TaxID=3154700 RepID=UPI0033C707F0